MRRLAAVLLISGAVISGAIAQDLSGTSGNLGTPGSLTLTNATGLPVATGISGFGTGVATFLATPSSANLAAALTNETGTGAAVFGTSPTIADAIDQTTHVNTATISKTDTTLSTGSITGVSQALTASGLYVCDGFIHFTTAPSASNGAKVALATSDTLTVNTLTFFVTSLNSAAFVAAGTGTATALAAAPVTPTAAMTDILLKAVINVNAAGTLQLQLAESTASGTIAATAGNVGWVCHRAA